MADWTLVFGVGAPAPQYVPAPHDAGLAQRVEKAAVYVHKNGPEFHKMMYERQQGSPEYAFLYGGDGYAFYLWVLYCSIWSIPWQQPPGQAPAPAPAPQPVPAQYGMAAAGCPQQAAPYGYAAAVQPMHPGAAVAVPPYQQPPPAAPAAGPAPADHVLALPDDLRVGFTSILATLQSTKESIGNAQAWVLASVAHSRGLAALMAQRARAILHEQPQQPDAFGRCTNLVFLANDVLFASQRSRATAHDWRSDPPAAALAEELPSMLSCAYALAMGGLTAAPGAERLPSMVDFWRDKFIFDQEVCFALRNAMMSGNPDVTLSAFLPAPGGAAAGIVMGGAQHVPPPQGQWGAPQGQHQAPPHGYTQHQQQPHHAQQPQSGFGAAQPQHQQQQHQQQQQPSGFADALFPPGLLPDLVRKANRGMPGAYEPINQGDIPAAPPPPGAVDSYLQSRLDRFYEDLEDGGRRRKAMNDREREKEADVAHKNHAERIASMKAGLARDAPDDQQGGDQLAAGAGLGAKAGIGARSQFQVDPSDPYASYRKSLSGTYHALIGAGRGRV